MDYFYEPDHNPRRSYPYEPEYNPRGPYRKDPEYNPRRVPHQEPRMSHQRDLEYNPRRSHQYGPEYYPREPHHYNQDYTPRRPIPDPTYRNERLDAPTFDGNFDPYIDWERRMDQYFEWDRMTEKREFQFAKTRLVRHARLHWKDIELMIRRQGDDPIATWKDMKIKLREKYVPMSTKPRTPPHRSGSDPTYPSRPHLSTPIVRSNADRFEALLETMKETMREQSNNLSLQLGQINGWIQKLEDTCPIPAEPKLEPESKPEPEPEPQPIQEDCYVEVYQADPALVDEYKEQMENELEPEPEPIEPLDNCPEELDQNKGELGDEKEFDSSDPLAVVKSDLSLETTGEPDVRMFEGTLTNKEISDQEYPQEVRTILIEFTDICPESCPESKPIFRSTPSPPSWDIYRAIDLVPVIFESYFLRTLWHSLGTRGRFTSTYQKLCAKVP